MATDLDEPDIDIHQTDEIQSLMRRRRGLEEAEMDITPMIDITFLLLIFFVVCSKMDPSGGVKLPAAEYGVVVAEQNCAIVSVLAAADGTGIVYLGNVIEDSAKVTASDPADQRRIVAEYVEKEITGNTRKNQVLVKADGAIKHREVAKILSAVSMGAEVQVIHIAVLEN